jgi:hypothetical protein
MGAVGIETLAPVYAQHRHRTWNGCPQGWTVQGGRCAPYRWAGGPYWGGGWNNDWGGGWNTWNGCPPVRRYRVEDARPTDGKVRQAANLLAKDEARRIAVNTKQLIAPQPIRHHDSGGPDV